MSRPSVVALVALGWLASAGSAWAHQGHSAPEPWAACAGHQLSDACAWEDAAHLRYVGTCRAVSDALLCVRNRPISAAPSASDSTRHVIEVAIRLPLIASPLFILPTP